MMRNLRGETLDVIQKHGHRSDEILYVTDGERWCEWDEFSAQAIKIDYDGGYGSNEINMGLKIVAKDWWLERHEYDGSEWWEFKTLPQRPNERGEVTIKEEW